MYEGRCDLSVPVIPIGCHGAWRLENVFTTVIDPASMG